MSGEKQDDIFFMNLR